MVLGDDIEEAFVYTSLVLCCEEINSNGYPVTRATTKEIVDFMARHASTIARYVDTAQPGDGEYLV